MPALEAGIELVKTRDVGIAWLAALVPIAFSFDGWIVSTSIASEVKNPKKNMTLALIIGPIIVLGVYLMFFLGLNKMLGAEYILSTRDAAINKVGEMLLGGNGTRILLTFVVISVLGVVNGVILGGLRMPQAMASKNMIPGSEKVKEINPKYQLSLRSCAIHFVASLAWMAVHYITQKTNALVGGDISEISIVFSYACYIVLYLKVLSMKKDKTINSVFKGVICPVFAIIGASIIFIGGFITNPVYVTFFILFCLSVCLAGIFYYKKNK
ncbi:MAG: APC family permease [Clostridiales bacterium]|nr:APC family permease [Clostridiales bacterium]